MFLFESGPTYRARRFGVGDTVAHFMHDLATAGVPMTLSSVKAATDAVGGTRRNLSPVPAAALLLPLGPLAGLP